MTNAEMRDVLIETRAYLKTHGWRPYNGKGPGTAGCLMHALGCVFLPRVRGLGLEGFRARCHQVSLHLARTLGWVGYDYSVVALAVRLQEWNDAQPSEDPVLELLDKAIAALEEQPKTPAKALADFLSTPIPAARLTAEPVSAVVQ